MEKINSFLNGKEFRFDIKKWIGNTGGLTDGGVYKLEVVTDNNLEEVWSGIVPDKLNIGRLGFRDEKDRISLTDFLYSKCYGGKKNVMVNVISSLVNIEEMMLVMLMVEGYVED